MFVFVLLNLINVFSMYSYSQMFTWLCLHVHYIVIRYTYFQNQRIFYIFTLPSMSVSISTSVYIYIYIIYIYMYVSTSISISYF